MVIFYNLCVNLQHCLCDVPEYTSAQFFDFLDLAKKCSFLDQEPIGDKTSYIGKRISRGFFQSKKGIIINAAINGAYNIVRKAFPNAFANGIEAVGLQPIRWKLAAVTS